ncbi:terpene synthase family protein [Streptomyces sp. ET3-23]|uniref:terpene synthase family protein n=1 Tax=Streptomyces sp. ET3-23 TaxID=2885643 RepID=UPI001D112748|nr:terpene synthase family protein [Streptomyces sp. ET3-23]MCC2277727.1 terpene synthase family protein [Streptomyces sp. ET3-23]
MPSASSPYPFPLPAFPWKCEPHPCIDAMEDWVTESIEKHLGDLPRGATRKYKDQKLGAAAGVILPYGSLERVRPAALAMLYTTVADDYYEFAEPEKTLAAADRMHNVILGAPAGPDDPGFLRLAAQAGQELRSFMPMEYVMRYAESLRAWLAHGVGRESAYRRARLIPPITELLAIRDYSIGVVFCLPLVELVLEQPLSPATAAHPLLGKLGKLVARMVVVQNDIASICREQERQGRGEVLNIILAVQHHWSLSLDLGYQYALHLGSRAADEFAFLQANLPDFGAETELVREYVGLLACMPGAWDGWYRTTLRYSTAHPETDWIHPSTAA